ncbi:winged helix-turn-helix transcriptional regulator [candidate division GN15 bacterium]|nr:winged helix-turn-helix transcriptional regulator [candidate division GN15 bacterium]
MLDRIDREILTSLQEDGRMPNKEIANRVSMAPSATSERMRRLREKGVIDRFETRLDAVKLGFGITAFTFVRTNELAGGKSIGEALAEIPEVQEVFNVAGEDCYLLKVRTQDTKTMGELLRERVGSIEGVVSTRTTIVMETFKETCKLPLLTD